MSKTTCGRSQRIGHGEFEVCGLMGSGGVWQCAHCEKLDRERVPASATRLTVHANGNPNSYATQAATLALYKGARPSNPEDADEAQCIGRSPRAD